MSANLEQRKLTAIMFTDLVGYSALAQRNEALALALLEEHRRLLRPLFPQFNGREVETAGDAFLVEFASALEATQCGVEIQRVLAQRNQVQPAERQIRLRIGIHVGDVVHKDGKVMGDAVNIAARIEPQARPGGICVSEDVARQIRNKLEQPLVALGPGELKNIELPVVIHRVLMPWEQSTAPTDPGKPAAPAVKRVSVAAPAVVALLIAVGGGWWLVHRSSPSPKLTAQSQTNAPTSPPVTTAGAADQKSIAVLAFANLSDDKANEYFSDGVSEELLNALAKVPGLKVSARTSAFHFKNRNDPIPEIAKQLGVAYVVEGSVRKAGKQLRITAQLISAADGFHVWSETYDRTADDVFAIQTEVAQRIQDVLKVKLLGSANNNKATLAGTENLEAYDLYLQAKNLWNRRTGRDIERAVGLFQQATEKDPKFAAAYAGLGASYAILPTYASAPPSIALPKARAAAQRALELDATSAEAHAVLATVAIDEWDYADAEREYQAALRLNPNHATTRHWRATFLSSVGRHDEALAEIRQAQALDPLSPVIQLAVGGVLYMAGRYDEAMAEVEKTARLAPDFGLLPTARGWVYRQQGKPAEALAQFETAYQTLGESGQALGDLGHIYAVVGRTNEARQILAKLEQMSVAGRDVTYYLAEVNLGLGDMDQTFHWVERATENRAGDPRLLPGLPPFGPIAHDPRYAALLKKLGLDHERQF